MFISSADQKSSWWCSVTLLPLQGFKQGSQPTLIPNTFPPPSYLDYLQPSVSHPTQRKWKRNKNTLSDLGFQMFEFQTQELDFFSRCYQNTYFFFLFQFLSLSSMMSGFLFMVRLRNFEFLGMFPCFPCINLNLKSSGLFNYLQN